MPKPTPEGKNENLSEELPLNRSGYEIGKHTFKSFLLAGERYLNLDLERKGTDEERFKKFYSSLVSESQEQLHGYFKRQATLDLSQRSKILGDLTDLKISDPLRLQVTAPRLVELPTINSHLMTHFNPGLRIKKFIDYPVLRKIDPGHKWLSLRLESLEVDESQDDYRIWPFGTVNDVDETSLSVIGIDETGDVTRTTHRLGSIKEGRREYYENKTLMKFSLREGDDLPKIYTTAVYAIERDSGGYNEMIDKAVDYVKSKVDEELIAAGIGTFSGGVIPPEVAAVIANAVKAFVDDFLDWLAGLFSNSDDLMGGETRRANIYSLYGNWQNSGTSQSNTWSWRFSGADGTWTTRMHWKLD